MRDPIAGAAKSRLGTLRRRANFEPGAPSRRPRSGERGRPIAAQNPPITPDGRYLVVRGRLWRCADPGLDPARRAALVKDLMSARRAVAAARRTPDREAEAAAHLAVDAAKHALGERGPVWWSDGAPDLTRHMAKNTPYAQWFASLMPAASGGRSPSA